MATDKLINQTQGDDIIDALDDIATNVGNITYGPQTSADKVVSMLGYAEAAEAASINPGDTLNVAIGKLEKKANDNATAVAGKIDKLTTATAGDIATVTATGEIADSAVSIADSNTGLADSDTAVPTSKTVKTYVDSTATGISRYLGTITAASGLSTSAKKGDFYVVKTAWTGVHAGDEIIAEKNGPAQTIDGTNWSLLHNEADTNTTYQFAEGTTNGTFLVTPSDTGTAQPVAIKGLNSAAYTTADTSSLTNDNNHVPTSALAKTLLDAKVPTTRKVNNKALSGDITLSASDVSAVPSGNVTTTLPASSAAASTSKVMSEKLVYDTYVQNSDLIGIVDNGAKNKLGLTLDEIKSLNSNTTSYQWNGNSCTTFGATFTFNEDGTISVSGTGGSSVPVLHICNFVIPETDEYVISGCPTGGVWNNDGGSGDTYRTRIGNASDAYVGADFGAGFVKSYTKGDIVHLQLNIARGYTLPSGFKFSPMICTKAQFNISSTYEPYALGNQVITHELIELCDSGAKNLWDFANPDSIRSTDITKNSNGSFTISCTNASWTQYFKTFTVDIGKTYALSFNVNSMTNASSTFLVIGRSTNTSGTEYFAFTPALGENRRVFTATTSTLWIAVYLNNSETARSVTATIEPMVCTKAAFSVSPKFVPYAKSNYSLTQLKLDRCDTVLHSGSLNNLKDNNIYYCDADVTDMPTQTRSWGFVRNTTYGADKLYGMQEFFSVTDPNESYFRVLRNGAWQSWKKQSDNVYYIQSTSASIANLLYTAAGALGYNPTERTHAGLISVSTDTIGEYALIWFMYKHGTTGQGISVSHNVIALSAINSSGTVALTGGTAPYNYGVMFFY